MTILGSYFFVTFELLFCLFDKKETVKEGVQVTALTYHISLCKNKMVRGLTAKHNFTHNTDTWPVVFLNSKFSSESGPICEFDKAREERHTSLNKPKHTSAQGHVLLIGHEKHKCNGEAIVVLHIFTTCCIQCIVFISIGKASLFFLTFLSENHKRPFKVGGSAGSSLALSLSNAWREEAQRECGQVLSASLPQLKRQCT